MSKITCIDVSYAQGSIDFKKVKAAGVTSVIIRAGYGSSASQKDERFEENYKNAKAAGLKVGAYWYSYAGWNGAKPIPAAEDEAQACLSVLKGKTFELPVFYDMEEQKNPNMPSFGKATCTKIAETFCDTVKNAGYTVGVYANLNWFQNYLDYSTLKKKYAIWLAQWSSSPSLSCDIWQNSDAGKVSGIAGAVDTDVVYQTAGGSSSSNSGSTPSVTYRVRAGGVWLPAVKDLEDFAGIVGKSITDVALKVNAGTVKYRVHVKSGKWLPYVSGYDTGDAKNGYAGNGKPIDAVQIAYTPTAGKSLKIKYRVSPLKKAYYPWQYGTETSSGQDGYAGVLKKEIDRLQVAIG